MKLQEKLQGYKTKVLALATATITLLQVFNITDLNEEQITAILTLLGTGMALGIYDKLNRG